MARVEKNQPMAEEMSQMKGDILKAVHKGKSKRPWFRSCVILLVVAILCAGGFVAWTLAATGLASVPVLSSWAYKAPSPQRKVAPGLSLEAYLKSGSFKGNVADIPETTMTALVQDVVSTDGQTWFDEHASQVAKNDDGEGVELYLPLRDNAQKSAIRARLDVSFDTGKVAVSVSDVTLGSWKLSPWLVSSVIAPAIAPTVSSINASLP
ncbi:MAG: hypothetical protein WCO25_00930 [Candidatus Uhrbacteria bacterium]